ncbi:hypothetical protein B566_EDAN014778 [Ephemera danica]|nr:hypothetical protein B566_EDAN014778 [Ephemera danica]
MFALAEKCNYGSIKDEKLHDKRCHGMRDRKLASDHRSNEELTPAEVLKRMLGKEAVLKDLQEEKDRVSRCSLDAVSQTRKGKFRRAQHHATPGPSKKPEQPRAPATTSKYPPGATLISFLQVLWHNPQVWQSLQPSQGCCMTIMQVCSSISTHPLNSHRRAKVQLGRYFVNFKVDSGADVTPISVDDFEQLTPRPLYKSPRSRIVAAGNQCLKTVGVFIAEMKYENVTDHERIFVIKGLDDNLLSRLGLIAAEYKITFRNGAEPYAIASPRRIPHPIRNQVKSQLDQMVKDGVISPVKEPTEWCAAIVPVPKASEPQKVRICVDHIQLNKAIIRKMTILPSVVETMAKFAGAKIFSKLDCKDYFWQIKTGFPANKGKWGGELSHYWTHSDFLTEQDGLVLYKSRITVSLYPTELREITLRSLHEGHQRLATMRARAQEAVYWPGLSVQLATAIDNCVTCLKRKNSRVEPLMPSETPAYPWERVSIDVADINGIHYLVTVDRFSRFPEVSLLPNLTRASIIKACKENFARHGIPNELMCDNATPLVGQEFKNFLEKWGITQVTGNHYPQSNVQAESAVKVVKRLFEACDDPYLALLAYRITLILGLKASSAQLSMGRNLRSIVPMPPHMLVPAVPPKAEIRVMDQIKREAQKAHHDIRYKAKEKPALNIGDRVWIKDIKREGKIVRKCSEPRSYMVKTAYRTLRQNNVHLTKLPKPENSFDNKSVLDFSLEGEMANNNFDANLTDKIPEQQADDQEDEPQDQEEVQPQADDPPE